jgi:hypothetical protein
MEKKSHCGQQSNPVENPFTEGYTPSIYLGERARKVIIIFGTGLYTP